MKRGALALALVALVLLCACGEIEAPPCTHPAWAEGACAVCGETCPHTEWKDGVCAVCALPCKHEGWTNGACLRCGELCGHEVWENGVCLRCGAVCDHAVWIGGVCDRCGSVCPHEAHDAETALCTQCGERCYHDYAGSVCSCGKAAELFTDGIPEEWRVPCDRQGTVEVLHYTTHDYHLERIRDYQYEYLLEKELPVYLPAGYDSTRKYNVLILMHGMYCTEKYWLYNVQEYGVDSHEMMLSTDVFDHMFAEGVCRECIIVTPGLYRNTMTMQMEKEWDAEQLAEELRRDILPLIVSTYSTFAESDAEEDIIAARDHFGYAGLSMGSVVAFNAILPRDLDLFSWFGCFSGGEGEVPALAETLNEKTKQYPLHYFYNACGTRDYAMYWDHAVEYAYLLENCPFLVEGENTVFIDHEGLYHEYKGWITDACNCLTLFFAGCGE